MKPIMDGTISMAFVHGRGWKIRLSKRATEILGYHIVLDTRTAAIMESLRALTLVVSMFSTVEVVSVVCIMALIDRVMTIVPARLIACSWRSEPWELLDTRKA
jgi:hypothetical protein